MNIVESNLQELYGVICWRPNWDGNLNLRINFGQPALKIREPINAKRNQEKIPVSFRYRQVNIHGEWRFWILCGYWKLSIRDFDDVTVASSHKRKNSALAKLNGQKLTNASVNPFTSATQFDFDLGARLSIRRISVENDGDIWSLYKPNSYVLSVRADGKYNDSSGDTKPDKIKWKPIVMV